MTQNPMIFTHELKRSFGNVVAVDSVSIRIERGTFFGLLGPNGAGKTTLIKLLTGQLSPDAGNASVGGFDIKAQRTELRKIIGIMSESPMLFDYLTVQEMIAFVGRLYGVEKTQLKQRVNKLLALLSLEYKADVLCKELSHGMRKKVDLACALIHKPVILFLDEPFSGIDPVDSLTIKNTLQNLRDQGVLVWVNSHLVSVVESLCDQVAVLHNGKLLAVGEIETVKQSASNSQSLEEAFAQLTGLQPKEGHLDF